MRLSLTLKSGPEADRGNANGYPAQLIGYTDNAEEGLALCLGYKFGVLGLSLLKPGPELTSANEACAKTKPSNEARGKHSYPRHLVPV